MLTAGRHIDSGAADTASANAGSAAVTGSGTGAAVSACILHCGGLHSTSKYIIGYGLQGATTTRGFR